MNIEKDFRTSKKVLRSINCINLYKAMQFINDSKTYYIIIIYKMFHYGLRIKDTKSKLILYGVGLYFFTHLLVNVGGVSGFIPMTGVPLLLISSGGSSTLAAMMGLGIAQSLIARYNRDLLKEQME